MPQIKTNLTNEAGVARILFNVSKTICGLVREKKEEGLIHVILAYNIYSLQQKSLNLYFFIGYSLVRECNVNQIWHGAAKYLF